MWGKMAFEEVVNTLPKGSRILDIGCGKGLHAASFREKGYEVETNDIAQSADKIGPYHLCWFEPADCIWCSHVLEHQRNPGLFLDKIRGDLKPDGLLALTVPPRKDEIVGGHVTLWNPGLLLYNLILAGFDCKEALVLVGGYDISVVMKKKSIDLPKLNHDHGDIDKLRGFFPLKVREGFNGWLEG